MRNFDLNDITLSPEQTVTLTDIRDNNTYTVAKLKDGKCWMTQNLRLKEGSYIVNPNNDFGGYYTCGQAQNKCPTGWNLPTNSDYSSLQSNEITIFNLKSSGYYNNGNYYRGDANNPGGNNHHYWLWTSTCPTAYYGSVGSLGNVITETERYSYGYSIRCVK